jgi:hypothetical protein
LLDLVKLRILFLLLLSVGQLYGQGITIGTDGSTNPDFTALKLTTSPRLVVTKGSGSPEGVITAAPGSLYMDTTGKVWKKATGTGNTGWSELATVGGAGAVTSVFGRTGAVTAVSTDYSTFYQPLDTQLTSLAALSYATNALKVVRVNAGATDFELATISTSPPGADTQVVFNDGGTALGADAQFTWDKTNNFLTVSTGAGGAGAIRTSDGSAGTPSFAFATDTSTGFYRKATDDVRLALSGVDNYYFKSSGGMWVKGGIIGLGGTFTAPSVVLALDGIVGVQFNNGTTDNWKFVKSGTTDTFSSTVTDGFFVGHHLSSGTPAAGMGSGINFNIDSTTTANVTAGNLQVDWVDPAHATRSSEMVIKLSLPGAAPSAALTVKPRGALALTLQAPAPSSPAEGWLYGNSIDHKLWYHNGTTFIDLTAGAIAAGSDQQIQFNDGGVTGADVDLTWDKTANLLTLSGTESIALTNATTNAVDNVLTLGHQSISSAAIGFGAGLLVQLETNSNPTRDAEQFVVRWLNVTDATRASALDINLANPTLTTALSLRAGGTVALTTQSSAPSSPVEGWLYANSTDHNLYFYDGSGFVDLTAAAGGGAVSSVTGTSPVTVSPTTGATVVGLNVGVDFGWTASQSMSFSDSLTNTVVDVLSLSRNSTSAGAAGLGSGLLLKGKTNTTNNQIMGEFAAAWVDPTDGTRKSQVTIKPATASGLSTVPLRYYSSGYLTNGTNADLGTATFNAGGGYIVNDVVPTVGKFLRSDGATYKDSAFTIPAPVTNGDVMTVTAGVWTSTAPAGGSVSDTAFASSWDTVTTTAPSKNAVYDWAHTFDTDDDGKVNVLDQTAGIPVTDASGVIGTPKAAPTGTIVGTSDTQTLTNKRRTRRVLPITSSFGTPTITTDTCDIVTITGISANITNMSTNLSGTPLEGDSLVIWFKDDGTARTIAWGTSFAPLSGTSLPTTTVVGKAVVATFLYSAVPTTPIWIMTGQGLY